MLISYNGVLLMLQGLLALLLNCQNVADRFALISAMSTRSIPTNAEYEQMQQYDAIIRVFLMTKLQLTYLNFRGTEDLYKRFVRLVSVWNMFSN